MGRNLGPLNIKDSYEGLVQISGSARDTLTDGSGSVITLLDISSSYAISASHALNSDVAISSSYALTASFALNSSASQSLQQVTNVGNITTNNIQAPVFFTTVSTGIDEVSVSLETLGPDEPFILANSSKVLEFDSAISSSKFAVYDVDVQTALTASGLKYPTADGTVGQVMTTDGAGNLTLAASGGGSVNTGSFYLSSSVVDATATFNQGDGSTESLTINNVANAVSASYALSASFATTASYALNAGTTTDTGSFYISSSVVDATATFNKGDGTTDSLTINNVANAVSASHAISSDTSISASYALSASFATNALSASYAPGGAAFPFTGSAGIDGNLDMNSSGATVISDWTGSLAATSIIMGVTDNDVQYVNQAGANNIQIGYHTRIVESSTRDNAVIIGSNSSGAQESVTIGNDITNNTLGTVAIGRSASGGNSNYSVVIGYGASLNGNNAITIGYNQSTTATDEINIGGKFRYNEGSNALIDLDGNSKVSGTLAVGGQVTINGSDIPVLINSATLGSGSAVDNLGQEAVGTTDQIEHMVFLTQAENDGLTPDDNTFYAISGSTTLNTGSFYYSSSVVDSTATFFQGDGTSESLTINTINGDITTGGVTGTVNIDFEDGNFFTVTPTGTVTITPTNTLAGRSQTVSIVIDNAASQTVNFSGILFAEGTAPTITAAGVDIVTLVSFGTTVYGTAVQNLS